jgi:CDP-paratose 2-epimerase
MSCIAGPRQFGNEDQGWVAHFLYSTLSNAHAIIYGDGRQVRDVLCVDDLVLAIEAVRERADITAGQIYNVGGGTNHTTSLLELIDSIEALTGRRLRYRTTKSRPGDQLVYVTDIGKIKRDTGWEPKLTVKQTLERIYDFWKRNRDVFVPATHPERELVAGALQEMPGAA